MTEEEAKTKWCPFYRHKPPMAGGPTRWVTSDVAELNLDHAHCIASACMAWRWDFVEENKDGVHPHTWPDLVKYHAADTNRRFFRHGFCGLSGAPK